MKKKMDQLLQIVNVTLTIKQAKALLEAQSPAGGTTLAYGEWIRARQVLEAAIREKQRMLKKRLSKIHSQFLAKHARKS